MSGTAGLLFSDTFFWVGFKDFPVLEICINQADSGKIDNMFKKVIFKLNICCAGINLRWAPGGCIGNCYEQV